LCILMTINFSLDFRISNVILCSMLVMPMGLHFFLNNGIDVEGAF